MKNYLLALLLPLSLLSCNGKKEKTEEKHYISILSLLRAQVAHVDTSLYSIIKTEYTDSTHIDTTYIPREEFGSVAQDFLQLPDLSDPKMSARFTEEPIIFDTLINQVIISYVPVDPKKEEFKVQKLLATPIPGEESRINNIILTREISNRDSFMHQEMLWMMNRSFQIITTRQKPGKPEVITTTKVTWNEDSFR